MKNKEIYWLLLMSLTATTLGTLYSIFNTDPHHWGFITGGVLDYIHGKHFFTDIYIQYGIGQPVLFKFLNYFFPINYTSIGIATSIAYALNLLIIYFNIRKLGNSSLAILITAVAFLLHPYAIYSWPDYWAGLALSLSCYFLLSENCIATSSFLFLAFIFRNTYALGILAASFSYIVFSIFNKQIRNKYIFRSILIFISLLGVYVIYLIKNGALSMSIGQAFGVASTEYKVGYSSVFTLLRRVFLPEKIYLYKNLVTTTVSALFYISFYILFLLAFKTNYIKNRIKSLNPGVLIFIALLGLAGIGQSTLYYEVFRIQNSCSPLYLILTIFIIIHFSNIELPKANKALRFIVGYYLLLLALKFPHNSSLFPIYDGNLNAYSESSIPYYKWHRFSFNEQKYYNDLYRYVCDGKKMIVNRTVDSAVPYLCPNQENAHILPQFSSSMLSRINPVKFAAEERGEFSENQVIVSEKPIVSNKTSKIIEIGKTNRPSSIRFCDESTVYVYHAEINR